MKNALTRHDQRWKTWSAWIVSSLISPEEHFTHKSWRRQLTFIPSLPVLLLVTQNETVTQKPREELPVSEAFSNKGNAFIWILWMVCEHPDAFPKSQSREQLRCHNNIKYYCLNAQTQYYLLSTMRTRAVFIDVGFEICVNKWKQTADLFFRHRYSSV